MIGSSAVWAANAPATQPASPGALANGPTSQPAEDAVEKGLAWLAQHQMKDGSWGQGDESREMGPGMWNIKDSPNVADSCMALMALYHAGSTPTDGPYRENIRAAVGFICSQIESSDDKSISITTLNGTRTQMKLGSSIDTFMAAQALAELKGKMADAAGNQRLDAALKKVLHKMEINQGNNGQWAASGWAPTLAQAEAAKALNTSAQHGMRVDEAARFNAQQYARADLRKTADSIGGAAGSAGIDSKDVTSASDAPIEAGAAGNAGVPLYSAAGDIAAMQASANSNDQMRDQLQQMAQSPTTQPATREAARQKLAEIDGNARDLKQAQELVLQRMNDPQFANGFGSNGGEEYLSYLNIGQSIHQRGGNDWKTWSDTMMQNLDRIQNDDGSWSGGHCITGRTFCTAAAVQVLCIDRETVAATPAAQK